MRCKSIWLLLLAVPLLAHSRANADMPLELARPAADQIRAIEKDLSDGKTYAELGVNERQKVRSALGRINAALERNSDLLALPDEQKISLYNDQELVNSLLTQAREDSRLVCRREKPVGSHMSVSKCLTVAERRRILERSQQDMASAQRSGRFDNK